MIKFVRRKISKQDKKNSFGKPLIIHDTNYKSQLITDSDNKNNNLWRKTGRNLKPIEKGTGTRIYINTEVNPRQIEIKINNEDKDRDENISPWDWINKAICQIDKLLEDIEIRSRRKDIEKEGKNSRISDNGNHQHATPRNHKDTNPKEKRKRFTTKARQKYIFINKEFLNSLRNV
ncbi:hypothetical protein RhiirC2_709387 [Rhizophagus irregularis]|uniref:Uncharacterized protein n=1 Tax=Rhizophagus irregularis TaxID=588596 RepID=A0A2N1NIL3_9GLOM|nr:hypothetical protein RhiirC2_709387 [Rhizophagus irregularis]